MAAYASLFKKALYPVWETHLRKRPTLAILRELERTQWASTDELIAIQSRELTRLLDHSQNHVPFYRERWREQGVDPRAIRSPADLRTLPLTRRADLRGGAGELRKSTSPPFADILKATSGTTGEALSFGYDLNSEYWRQAIKFRGYGWAGYQLGTRTIHYWGGTPTNLSRQAKLWMDADRTLRREFYFDSGTRNRESMNAVIDGIRRIKPHSIVAYTAGIAELSRYIVETGARSWETIPVICGAEKLFDGDRKTIEAAFGPEVFETYGSRETMLIGSECAQHDGLHQSMENLVVEVIVSEQGIERAAEPGEVGEIVVTDLHNFGMPFIRYVNGDLGTLAAPGTCACGRALTRLKSVDGRTADSLRDGKGGLVSGLAFSAAIASIASAIQQFQVRQRKDNSITIHVVKSPIFGPLAEEVLRGVAVKYLPSVPFSIEYVDEIPLTASGKRRVVIVE